MTEAFSKNDPSENWSEDIKQAYEHLKIPSLYDAVLANEKLSLEIRRQDRDLKAILEGIGSLSNQFNLLVKIIDEEWEEYEQDENFSSIQPDGFINVPQNELTDLEIQLLNESQINHEKHSQMILMETHDNLRDLTLTIKQKTNQLISLFPKKEGLIPHVPVWYPIAEELIQNIVEGIDRCRYQFLARLEEMQIETLEPQLGEVYDNSLHHMLVRVSGGIPGTIAQVVRVGYRQNQNILRLAEVTVYQ